jgi:hypothetical protein
LLFLLAAAGLALTTSSAVANKRALESPWSTPVAIPISTMVVADSGVVRYHGLAWLATVVTTPGHQNLVRIYRWSADGWKPSGVTSFSQAPGALYQGGVRAVDLTHSGAPDFALRDGDGADWVAFSLITHAGGRWHQAQFAEGAETTPIIDARVVRNGMVQGEADASGGAGGPETYAWWRFSGDVFVPAAPPGPPAPCDAIALDRAGLLAPALPGRDEAEFARPFHVTAVACLDGWALATGTVNGARLDALFEQDGRTWLRAAVGSSEDLRDDVGEAALAPSVFGRLADDLRLRLREPRQQTGPGVGYWDSVRSQYRPGWAGSIPYLPSSSFASTADPNGRISIKLPGSVVVAEESDPARSGAAEVTVRKYTETRGRWSLHESIRFGVSPPGPEGAVTIASGRRGAGLYFVGGFEIPDWLAVVSDRSGRLVLAPFRIDGHEEPVVEASHHGNASVEAYTTPSTLVTFTYRDGVFQQTGAPVTAACTARALERVSPRGSHWSRIACGYGNAIAIGTRAAKPVAGVFAADGARWYFDGPGLTPPSELAAAFSGSTVAPTWVADHLETTVGITRGSPPAA